MYFISAWRAGRDCTGPAYSQAPRWVSPLSELRPSFIEKTWYFYRPWQPGGHPRGGGPQPMGSTAPRVGAHFHQMEIAPRCLLPKLVTGQQDGGSTGRCHPSCLFPPPPPLSYPDCPQGRWHHTSSLPKNIMPSVSPGLTLTLRLVLMVLRKRNSLPAPSHTSSSTSPYPPRGNFPFQGGCN